VAPVLLYLFFLKNIGISFKTELKNETSFFSILLKPERPFSEKLKKQVFEKTAFHFSFT